MTELATPAAQSAAAPVPATPAAAASDWKAGLPADLQPLVTTKGWKSPADALKSYANLEKLVGTDRIALPSKTRDGNRDWSSWDGWAALGRPETPDKYAFKAADNVAFNDTDRAFQTHMAPLLHKAGLAQWQVDLLADGFGAFGTQAREQGERRALEEKTAAEAALRHEWDTGYDRQMALANRALRQFGGSDVVTALNDAGLGRHPAVIRAFARIGAALAEDGGLPGESDADSRSVTGEIERLKSDRDFQAAFLDRLHPGHAAAMAKMLRLQARMVGKTEEEDD